MTENLTLYPVFTYYTQVNLKTKRPVLVLQIALKATRSLPIIVTDIE
jgi:hypothetical protein